MTGTLTTPAGRDLMARLEREATAERTAERRRLLTELDAITDSLPALRQPYTEAVEKAEVDLATAKATVTTADAALMNARRNLQRALYEPNRRMDGIRARLENELTPECIDAGLERIEAVREQAAARLAEVSIDGLLAPDVTKRRATAADLEAVNALVAWCGEASAKLLVLRYSPGDVVAEVEAILATQPE